MGNCHNGKLTERELKLVKLFGCGDKILHNVYVPDSRSETFEIDVLFITHKGIFVIESKSYSGFVLDNEADRSREASLPNGQKSRFCNPRQVGSMSSGCRSALWVGRHYFRSSFSRSALNRRRCV